MRLIDANALRYEIVKYFDGLPIQGHYDMLKMVDKAPTIEAELVKKGKWEDVFCSVCGEEAITEWNDTGGEHIFSPYCPNCGAKMERSADE